MIRKLSVILLFITACHSVPQVLTLDEALAAAETGSAEAQSALGDMYNSGQGVAQDYTQAVIWYRKAAEQGLAKAQCSLAYLYQHGYGVTRDEPQAATWYTKAAEQGDVTAQMNLALMYEHAFGVKKDYQKTVYWYTKAAEQGDLSALENLGYLYFNGQGGIPRDYQQAYVYFAVAAAAGYEGVTEWRDKMAAKLTTKQVEEAKLAIVVFQKKIKQNKVTEK